MACMIGGSILTGGAVMAAGDWSLILPPFGSPSRMITGTGGAEKNARVARRSEVKRARSGLSAHSGGSVRHPTSLQCFAAVERFEDVSVLAV